MKSWYSIVAKSDTVAEISIYEEIGLFGVTAKQFITDLKAIGNRRIVLRLNSPGGDVFEGLAIYNRLKEHTAGVEVRIDGLAASMGSVIAMAGAPVKIAENAMIMIHNPSSFAVGDSEDLRDIADTLDKVRSSLITTYERKTGIAAAKLVAMMDAETWMNATEAKAYGFVDEITEPVQIAARFDKTKFRNCPPTLTNMNLRTKILAALTLTDPATPLTDEQVITALTERISTITGLTTERDGLKVQVTNLTTERDNLSTQFAELTKVANKAKEDLTAEQGKVTALTGDRDTIKGQLTTATTNVSRLETLCKLKGINPENAVPNIDDPEVLTDAHFENRLRNATSPAERMSITAEYEKAVKEGRIK